MLQGESTLLQVPVHLSMESAPSAEEVPKGQRPQPDWPGLGWYSPAAQAVHSPADPVEKLPAAQAVQLAADPVEKLPAAQGVQAN
jgi:hypothetical protein